MNNQIQIWWSLEKLPTTGPGYTELTLCSFFHVIFLCCARLPACLSPRTNPGWAGAAPWPAAGGVRAYKWPRLVGAQAPIEREARLFFFLFAFFSLCLLSRGLRLAVR